MKRRLQPLNKCKRKALRARQVGSCRFRIENEKASLVKRNKILQTFSLRFRLFSRILVDFVSVDKNSKHVSSRNHKSVKTSLSSIDCTSIPFPFPLFYVASEIIDDCQKFIRSSMALRRCRLLSSSDTHITLLRLHRRPRWQRIDKRRRAHTRVNKKIISIAAAVRWEFSLLNYGKQTIRWERLER